MLLDALESQDDVHEIVERDDGFIDAARISYFAPMRRWLPVERRALRFVRGRVLDAGVGAGRVALELQGRGRDVVGIDVSPGAVEVARRRGVRDVRLLPLERVDASLGHFGTVAMFGNNLGLLGGAAKGHRLLRRLAEVADRIVAMSIDPYRTDDALHLAYHQRNRSRGRMAGQLRLRVRHRDLASPWFDYLIVSPAELEGLVVGTGWRVAWLVTSEGSAAYVAVLDRDS
jgi:SAM-dependent methyltransferase